ncbi:BspA family leucine-rich repeat surface protein [bacterium]|nr:BspA family leucine-rich repeat surface protein [bacterium]
MKQLNTFINEKLKINSKSQIKNYNYFPKDRNELMSLIKELLEKRGKNANLNDIDVSKITDMSRLFQGSAFNGDISEWDVSNVDTMLRMFAYSNFDGDISKWNVNPYTDMKDMFRCCPIKIQKNTPKWYHE